MPNVVTNAHIMIRYLEDSPRLGPDARIAFLFFVFPGGHIH
jgi:hypothetical protein